MRLSLLTNLKLLFILLLIVLISLCIFNLSCASNSELDRYIDEFYDVLDKEIDIVNMFIDEINSLSFYDDSGIIRMKINIPNYIDDLRQSQDFYESPVPSKAPKTLITAISHAQQGTEKYISGINLIDSSITNLSETQFSRGADLVNEGADYLNTAIHDYNIFVDSYNAEQSTNGANIGFGFLIGTGVVWISGIFIIYPIAKYFTRKRYLNGLNVILELEQIQLFLSALEVDTDIYIITDILILGILGFTMGIVAGWFFIGITWRVQHIPGLLSFIGFSFLGYFLHG